jgi:hypothetical protein
MTPKASHCQVRRLRCPFPARDQRIRWILQLEGIPLYGDASHRLGRRILDGSSNRFQFVHDGVTVWIFI